MEEMVTTILDNGKLVKPAILTDEDKDGNGRADIGEFFKVNKNNTAGKTSVSEKPVDWAQELVPVRKSEKKSFILNGIDTRTLCTIEQANEIADTKINDFAKVLTQNQVVDTFKEMVDYAAKHQNETLNIFATLDEHAQLIEDETNNRIEADDALDAAIKQEVADRTAEVTRLDSRIDDTNEALATEAQTRKAADDKLTEDLATESQTRKAADDKLAEDLATESQTRKAADDKLAEDLATESQTRKAADDALDAALKQEIADREKAVSDEAKAREAADKVLTRNLNKEIAAREAADEEEEAAREAADNALSEAIADEKKQRIEAIQAEAKARNDADTSLNNKIETEIDNRKAAIAEEKKAREAADDKLAEDLATEAQTREAEDNALSEAIAEEAAIRAEDIGILTNNLAAETEAREAADTSLSEDIAAEAEAREAADTAEAEAREAADTAEAEARTQAIAAEAEARETADTAEAEAREAADAELLAKFDNYYTSEETDEAIDTAIEEYKDAKFHTIENKPEEAEYTWKAGVKLGELKNGNKNLLLFKKNTTTEKVSFIGGEMLIEIDNGEHIDHHNISLSSTGSNSYDGCSDSLIDTSIFQCRYNGEKYYGISIPKISYRQDSTYNSFSLEMPVGFIIQGSNYNLVLGLGAGSNSTDVFTAVGERAEAYANWGYMSVKQFCKFLKIPNAAVKDTVLGKYYNYYIFFKIRYQSGNAGIRDIRVAPAIEYETTDNTNYTVKNSISLLNEQFNSIFNWNGTYVKSDVHANITLNSWYSHETYSFCHYQEAGTYEVIGDLKEKDFNTAKIFFNGWLKEDEALLPPETYTDSDLYDITFLNDEDTNTTEIRNANGELVSVEDLPENEQSILESPYKTVEIKTASGSILTTNVINAANTFTSLCETVDLQDVVTEGQAFLAGINFHLLPLKNKMLITENSLIYVLSALNTQFGSFECQGGIYKLVTINGSNYLKVIATTNKETISHDTLNYFTGYNPALKIVNVKETLLDPSKGFYYVGVMGGYRADMLGNNYWIGGVGNKAPASAYHHDIVSYWSSNLNDNNLQQIPCNSVNAQINYIRVVSGE